MAFDGSLLHFYMGKRMAVVEVACCKCKETDFVIKYGKSNVGTQRYHCKQCKATFQLNYAYNGNRPETPERIVDMTMNGSGVRDIARVLKISPTTVVEHLKNCPLQK